MVFRGTPFGIGEYILGKKFHDLPLNKNLAHIKLFSNFWTSVIIITGFLQILGLILQRRKLESHFQGHIGEINFIAMFLLYARQVEKTALLYRHSSQLIGGDGGAIVFEQQLNDWHLYKKCLVEKVLKDHLERD